MMYIYVDHDFMIVICCFYHSCQFLSIISYGLCVSSSIFILLIKKLVKMTILKSEIDKMTFFILHLTTTRFRSLKSSHSSVILKLFYELKF